MGENVQYKIIMSTMQTFCAFDISTGAMLNKINLFQAPKRRESVEVEESI